MKILIVQNSQIPTHVYDDAERISEWLAKSLVSLGQEVVFLVKKDSQCGFAPVLVLDEKKPLNGQIPEDVDLVHFFYRPPATLFDVQKPYLITYCENSSTTDQFDPNTVFLSAHHAVRHGGSVYVYPGIDPDDYGPVMLDLPRKYFHFLANSSWQGKNIQGAVDLTARVGSRLHVIGGSRVNFRNGLRVTLSPSARFHGVLGVDGRNILLNGSRGLIYPINRHEPFGLAIPESLYFGCPIFGTPYGALPELLCRKPNGEPRKGNWTGQVDACFSDFGFLSLKRSELLEAIRHAAAFQPDLCHEYAMDCFTAVRMTRDYLRLYEQVLNGIPLHEKPLVMPEAPSGKFLPIEG